MILIEMLSPVDFLEPLFRFAADSGSRVQNDSEKHKAGIVITAGVAFIGQSDEGIGQSDRLQAIVPTKACHVLLL